MAKGKSSPYLARRAKQIKRVKKDYQRKPLNNPFFRKRNNQPTKDKNKWRHLFRFFLIILSLAILLYIFCFSNLFVLKEVKVIGVSRIAEDNLSNFVWQQSQSSSAWLFKQDNLLFFKTDDLSVVLSENFSFDSLGIYKEWPHTLVLSANERGLAFIWQDEEKRAFSDAHGCLISEASVQDDDINEYPLLEAIGAEDYLNNRNCLALDDIYLETIFSLYEKLKNYSELKVARFLLDGTLNTIQLDLAAGPNIFFNTKEDLDKQLNKLIIIKQEKNDDEFQSLEYIDLRYGDRAYFK